MCVVRLNRHPTVSFLLRTEGYPAAEAAKRGLASGGRGHQRSMRAMHASIPALDDPTTWTWQRSAACRGQDASLFFGASQEEAIAATLVCDTCTVRARCLAFALERGERYGIWGGTTEKERAAMTEPERERARRAARAEGSGLQGIPASRAGIR